MLVHEFVLNAKHIPLKLRIYPYLLLICLEEMRIFSYVTVHISATSTKSQLFAVNSWPSLRNALWPVTARHGYCTLQCACGLYFSLFLKIFTFSCFAFQTVLLKITFKNLLLLHVVKNVSK